MRALILPLALLCACGSGSIENLGQDAAPRADYSPPECQVEFGKTFVLDEVVIMPAGEGVDITGDGMPDNLLGVLAPLANPVNAADLESGAGIWLLDFVGWNGTADDDQSLLRFYLGVDADSPPDPSNNFDGDAQFRIFDRQLDVNCQPLTSEDGAMFAGGVATAEAEAWRFVVQSAGTIEYRSIHASFQFAETLDSFDGAFGAAWTVCNLSQIAGTAFAGTSALRTIVNNLDQPNPDLDIDGDGLEVLVGDGEDIVACIDGDGTELLGPECACDPRIADAYSVSVQVHAVPAEITGIIYAP